MTNLTCDMVLERMLEADPAELRGEADSELARHIAGCDRCAGVAAAMLDETHTLDGALDHLAGAARLAGSVPDPMAAANAAADAALAAIREPGTDDVVSLDRHRETRTHSTRTHSIRHRWRRAAWIPLAAAAALAAVLVYRQNPPFPTTAPAPAPEPTIRPVVSVTPPGDRSAAIMETENPNITIVWLFDREES